MLGGVTIACAVCVLLFLKESPKDAGFKQDFSLIAQKKNDGSRKTEKNKGEPASWKDLFRSPFLRLVSAAYLVVFACKTSVTEWGQMYLIEDLGHSPFIGI